MTLRCSLNTLLLAGLSVYLPATYGAAISLPADALAPTGSGSVRGLLVRTTQAPQTETVANSITRAIKQLNGTLLGADGALVANEAIAGSNADGSYTVDVISFEKDGLSPIDLTDADENWLASFDTAVFPGIPGTGGHTDNFATEVVAFLELTAGEHTLGISVNADRTDMNNDDTYQVYVSASPRDYFGASITAYQRNAAAFKSDQHIENQFVVSAPAAGIYPFRIVYAQTGLGANFQFYSVDTDTGERILINNPNDDRAIKSYTVCSATAANAPVTVEVSPLPGSDGISPTNAITAQILDGTATVATSQVTLYLNNVAVTPQTLTKTGGRLSVAYTPNANRTTKDNLVRLEFTDSTGAKHTNSWSFGITVSGGAATTVTGQWNFDSGDLKATVGTDLEYFDGVGGTTQQGTEFGTTTALGIPDIDGKAAKVMKVPGDESKTIGYLMTHNIAPNGGGTRVNQWTLIMDVLVDTNGASAASLIKIISYTVNNDDGDLFWQGNNFGQGSDGYKGRGTFTAGEWHRVVAAYDEAANPPVVTKYVDGIKQDDWTANQGLDAVRRALLPKAVLFADDGSERRTMWVNSIQIRSGKLSDAEMVALGGPSADKIPVTIPASTVTGQWNFDYADLGANVGKALEYFDGTDGLTAAGTQFGTTTDLGVADINGTPAKIMVVPGDQAPNVGYLMTHLISPNGGGTRVNQWTLIMDIMVDPAGSGAASLIQMSSYTLDNNQDGDLFWQDNNFGQGSDGYKGLGTFTAGEWHRVIAAYDEAASTPVVTKFVDGIKQDDWTANQGLDAIRRTLLPKAVLFADDGSERRAMWVNSVQIRSGKLTDAQMVALGGPSAAKIPVVIEVPSTEAPTLSLTVSGDNVVISWPATATGYTLQSATVLTSSAWTDISGVQNNSYTVSKSAGNQFFRLKK
jgi:hypothetical protein